MTTLRFLISGLLLFVAAGGEAETLVMPEELVELARQKGCDQIEDFFKRPGLVNPPYVYGYLPGDERNSAAFWCRKKTGSSPSYSLLFMFRDTRHELARCPDRIEWENPPGGLSVYRDKRALHHGFVGVRDPIKKLRGKIRLRNNAILSEYDGVSELFYCHKGEWFVLQRD